MSVARKLHFPQNKAIAAERSEALRHVPLFADIRDSVAALRSVADILVPSKYAPGEAIIRESEQGAEMYLLVEGRAAVRKSTPDGDDFTVALLDSGQHAFFGEGGLLDSEARSATITAETECICLILHRSAFEDFSRAHPEWAMPIYLRIARVVMGRLRKANQDWLLLYNALVEEIRGS